MSTTIFKKNIGNKAGIHNESTQMILDNKIIPAWIFIHLFS